MRTQTISSRTYRRICGPTLACILAFTWHIGTPHAANAQDATPAATAAATAPPATPAPKVAQDANAQKVPSTGFRLVSETRSWDPNTASPAEAAKQAALAAEQAAAAAQLASQAVLQLTQHIVESERDVPTDTKALPEWAAHAGLNLLMSTGNATSFSGQVTAGVDGNWRDWSLQMRGDAGYAQNSPLGTTAQPTIFNSTFVARGDRYYTRMFSTYARGSILQDRIASIRLQSYGDVGVGLLWWEVLRDGYIRSRLQTSVGFRVLYESRHQYYPTEAYAASKIVYGPPISVSFRYGLTKDAYFTEDLDVTPDITGGGDTRLQSTTALTAPLTRRTGLQLGLKVRYIGQPVAGKRTTDTELGAGIYFSM